MAKKLPKTLYVKVEGEKGEEYFNACDELFPLVEMGQKDKVGVYQLVEVQNVEGVTRATKAPIR